MILKMNFENINVNVEVNIINDTHIAVWDSTYIRPRNKIMKSTYHSVLNTTYNSIFASTLSSIVEFENEF